MSDELKREDEVKPTAETAPAEQAESSTESATPQAEAAAPEAPTTETPATETPKAATPAPAAGAEGGDSEEAPRRKETDEEKAARRKAAFEARQAAKAAAAQAKADEERAAAAAVTAGAAAAGSAPASEPAAGGAPASAAPSGAPAEAGTPAAAAPAADAPPPKPPSPNQPRLNRAVELLRELVAEDAVEEAYINEPNDDLPTLVMKSEHWAQAAPLFRDHTELGCDYLRNVSGVDYETYMEVVYYPLNMERRETYCIKVRTDREQPSVPSATPVWETANWNEREIFDLLGIDFPGHPNMTRIMMPDDWVGHPLRKDYVPLDPEV